MAARENIVQRVTVEREKWERDREKGERLALRRSRSRSPWVAGCAALPEVLVELAEVEGGRGVLDFSVVTYLPTTPPVRTPLEPPQVKVILKSGEQ